MCCPTIMFDRGNISPVQVVIVGREIAAVRAKRAMLGAGLGHTVIGVHTDEVEGFFVERNTGLSFARVGLNELQGSLLSSRRRTSP